MIQRLLERLRPYRKTIVRTAAVLVAVTSVFWIPAILRPLDFFHVRRVTVRGAKYVDSRALVRQMAIDTTVSIWNSLDVYASRIVSHPQIRSVRLSRRLPSTVIVTIEENVPVAFVPASGGLRAYDEDARHLPLDPTRFDIDLPILSRADTSLLRFLADLRRLDPAMFARVSEVERTGRDEAIVFLSSLPVRIRSSLPADRFSELRAVEEDLAQRRVVVAELDLRFRDRVIVRLQ
ncbi:MAG TPA: FtsQ-type POTRA domain-containing protein [Gemmatimonadaceae bacterium]|nr:FtsQ-type POTRA domain-containing protein [Gemmatimonadaceae bacterium]